MFFEALHRIGMRAEPSQDSPILETNMFAGEVGREVDATEDGKWHELVLIGNTAKTVQGWVKSEGAIGPLIKEVAAPPRPDFSLVSFLKTCFDSQNWFNARNAASPNKTPFFVLADYLIAWASIESKLKNSAALNPLTDGVGPFQITTDSWARFLGSEFGADFLPGDRDDGLFQVLGAAFLAHEAMVTISAGVTQNDAAQGDAETSGSTGPYVPSYVDVFLVHLLGADAALALRLEKLRDGGGKSIALVLEPHFQGNLQTLLDFRSALLKDSAGGPETVDGALLKVESLLNAELEKALKLIVENVPEELPKSDGSAPWIDVAERELADWEQQLTNEHTAQGTQRVQAYFQSIRSPIQGVEPWCGAFAGFCMESVGVPPADGPARAANWASWGNVSIPLGQSDVPKGAVVVLAPEKGSGRSGHVGFFVEFIDNGQMKLLGGNQSDTVSKMKVARSKVVAIRWLSPMTERDSEQAAAAMQHVTGGALAPLLSLIADHESNGNYNAFFGNTRNRDNPAFVGMSVDEVLAWQRQFVRVGGSPSSAVGRYQFLRKTLAGLRDQGIVAGRDLLDEGAQDKLAIALMNGRGLGRFLSGSLSPDDFGVNLAKEWASLPVTKDVRRGNRTVREGSSYYAGDGLNRALLTVGAFRAILGQVRAHA